MNRGNHSFKKQFGQNFLRNQRFAKEMIEILDIQSNDIIIEIGPGDGMVTNLLLNSAAKLVVAVEVDYQLLPTLVTKFNDFAKFELVNKDILQVQWQEVSAEFVNPENVQVWEDLLSKSGNYNLKIIGSLPYNISKMIIKQAVKEWLPIAKMVFIVQEEVAQDYVAAAPKSTFLSNWIRLYANVKKHRTIPASQFFPQPKVNGGILEITPKQLNKSQKANLQKQTQVMRQAFSSPRKTLRNNLKSMDIKLEDALQNKRASEIDLHQLFDSEGNITTPNERSQST